MSSINNAVNSLIRAYFSLIRDDLAEYIEIDDLDEYLEDMLKGFWKSKIAKDLLEDLKSNFSAEPIKKRSLCCATTRKNNKCSKIVSGNSTTGDYCEMHIFLENEKNEDETIVNNECIGTPKKNSTGKCSKSVSIFSKTGHYCCSHLGFENKMLKDNK